MITITICRSAVEMDSIAGLWRALQTERRYTIFQDFGWNRLAASIFFQRQRPYVIAVEADSGAAIIPAAVVGGEYVSLLGEELFDYRDCLWSGEAQVLQQGWAELAKLRLPLHFKGLRGDPGEQWRRFECAPFTHAFASHPGQQAASLKLQRQFQRLLRSGCRVSVGAATPNLAKAMYRDRAATNHGDLFSDPLRVEMIAAMVQTAPDGAQLHQLTHGDRPLTSILTFRDGEWERFYGTHYDRSWARYSPGVSLAWWVREQSLAHGSPLDYMTGEQHYKQRLADSATMLYTVSADPARLDAIGETEPLPIAA